MSGLYIIILFCVLCIGICVWLWGCTGKFPKPKSDIDNEISRNRVKRYYDGALK